LFRRREQREGADKDLRGLWLERPRKSIEPMVLAWDGAHAKAVRTLPLFISEGAWDDDALLQRHGQEGDQVWGEADGVLPVDGRDFLQQGQESVGVKRQYCGEVGKRAHCHAGVGVGEASRKGYPLGDRCRYLPQEWVEDDTYAARRRCCGVPTAVPAWARRGRKPTRARVGAGAAAPHTVGAVAPALPAEPWAHHRMKEGRKGPMVAACAAGRVIAGREGLPGPEVWRVLRRPHLTGERKTSVRNAPVDLALATLVRLSGMRWPLATCFEDGKHSLGLGDDEGRRWRGWPHPMTLGILAHFFLVRACRRCKKKPRAGPSPRGRGSCVMSCPHGHSPRGRCWTSWPTGSGAITPPISRLASAGEHCSCNWNEASL